MKQWSRRLSKEARVALLAVYGVMLLVNAWYSFHLTAELNRWGYIARYYWEEALFVLLLLWNPKGMKWVALGMLLFDTGYFLRSNLLFARSGGTVAAYFTRFYNLADLSPQIKFWLEVVFHFGLLVLLFWKTGDERHETLD